MLSRQIYKYADGMVFESSLTYKPKGVHRLGHICFVGLLQYIGECDEIYN